MDFAGRGGGSLVCGLLNLDLTCDIESEGAIDGDLVCMRDGGALGGEGLR